MINKRSALLVLAAPLVVALATLLVAPAAAHHKADHESGGGNESKPATTTTDSETTEDNDSNDNDTPNNVADDGDNAHPSGNDRSVEHGNSGNQGKATSDPDDDTRGPERTNGGADKADGPGGADLADQDGNNGCGNDDDFEDDNEGHCRQSTPPTVTPPTDKPTPPGKIDDDDTVRHNPGRTIPDEVLSLTPDGGLPDVEVALPAADRPSTLPMTGSSLAMVLLAGLGLIVLGSSLVLVRRRA